ncbi:hypothetical protein EDD95_7686 [Streptomyces sp. CEV 2-1]|nr:hypothetical protein EDD95_7686 [Streptomyces sp. CEV 2-1]
MAYVFGDTRDVAASRPPSKDGGLAAISTAPCYLLPLRPRALVTGYEAQDPPAGQSGGLSRAEMIAELRGGAGLFERPAGS